MKRNLFNGVLISISSIVFFSTSFAQVESPSLVFNRGMLWNSVFFGKIGPNFNNWARRGIGLDWPGFDESWIREDIGGPPSHLLTGGFWIGAKKSPDSIVAVEDWSIYGGTVSNELGAKYIVTKHTHKYKDGSNFWLKTNPSEGEEVIETVWEYNINYTKIDDIERQLPLRVTRRAHQWSGSKRNENYIIYKYTFKNISAEIKSKDPARVVADTLYGVHLLLNYALQINSRSWNVLFPSLTPGARNSWFFYDPSRRMIWGRAGDYRETIGNEDYGLSLQQGPIVGGKPSGEYLAPGFVGVKLLYSSPDTFKVTNRVAKYGWSAASNSIDLSGPFTGIGSLEAKYQVLQDPARAASFVLSPADTVFMRRNRMWSLISLGPWKLLPGDSIVIALAEIVDGVDYKIATDTSYKSSYIGTQSSKIFYATSDKAQFTYDNKLNHPDPPAAPKFEVDFYKEKEKFVANVITWGNETESQLDPDDGRNDIYGYKIWRSWYLPIGPWDSIGTVVKGDLKFFNPAEKKYSFVDSTVQIGANYYYALTAFDTGKTSWPVNLSARFPETGSNRVPSLESSIFANRTIEPFKATIPPFGRLDDVLVVPNPFVIGEGFSQPGAGDEIQFVNIPNPCVIRIYTVRGDHVKTIHVKEGMGAITGWNQVTDYGQYVESGVYIYHLDAPGIGKKIGKFAIVR
jgi:hypothetical protein